MSVIMMMRVKGDADELEKYANAHTEQLRRIVDDGKSKGLIHHYFAAADGELVVVDEWPNEEAFQSFFDGQKEIPEVLKGAGAKGKPDIKFYRKLTTPDEF